MPSVIQNKATEVAKKPTKTIADYVEIMKPQIARALPSVITPERFTRMTLTALSSNPLLAQCTPKSFLGAMMNAAQMGLEPNSALQQAYLIPYKNKGVYEVQFQIGYKGLIDLAYRSGEVEMIQAQIVYENDHFECQYGLEPKLVHIPADSNRGNAVKVYAMFKTKNGGYGFEVMSMDGIKNHAKKYSQAYGSAYSPWSKNLEEMAKKTVLKRVLKYAPMKTDFVRGMVQDETIKTEISDDMFTVPDTTEEIEADYTEVNTTEENNGGNE